MNGLRCLPLWRPTQKPSPTAGTGSVDAVDRVAPYISRTFDIQHSGEGFVLVAAHLSNAVQLPTHTVT